MEKELCVRCGKETPYDKSTPLSIRLYYVESSGQLCADCWKKVYPFKEYDNKQEESSGQGE